MYLNDISFYIYVIILFFIEQKLTLIKYTLFSSKYQHYLQLYSAMFLQHEQLIKYFDFRIVE